jgi:hypothetical protein
MIALGLSACVGGCIGAAIMGAHSLLTRASKPTKKTLFQGFLLGAIVGASVAYAHTMVNPLSLLSLFGMAQAQSSLALPTPMTMYTGVRRSGGGSSVNAGFPAPPPAAPVLPGPNRVPDVVLAPAAAAATVTGDSAAASIASAGANSVFESITSAINSVKDTLTAGPSQVGLDLPPATAEQMMYTGPPPHF